MKTAAIIVLLIIILLIMLWSSNRKNEEKQQKKDLVEKWAKDNPEEVSRIMHEKMDGFFPAKKSKDEQKE